MKCFDLTANPYLLLAGLLAAGFDGIARDGGLPEPIDVDPAALTPRSWRTVAFGGCQRACGSPLTHWPMIRYCATELGSTLVDSVIAVRNSEIELLRGCNA